MLVVQQCTIITEICVVVIAASMFDILSKLPHLQSTVQKLALARAVCSVHQHRHHISVCSSTSCSNSCSCPESCHFQHYDTYQWLNCDHYLFQPSNIVSQSRAVPTIVPAVIRLPASVKTQSRSQQRFQSNQHRQERRRGSIGHHIYVSSTSTRFDGCKLYLQ